MAKLTTRIVWLSLCSYSVLSFAVSGAAEAQQREARLLLNGALGERPATLAACDQAKYGRCLDEGTQWCGQANNSGSTAATCIKEKQQCKSQHGC